MIQRVTDDRRAKKIKVRNDRRKTRRRKDDTANIMSYYVVLGMAISFFLFIAVISFVWGR